MKYSLIFFIFVTVLRDFSSVVNRDPLREEKAESKENHFYFLTIGNSHYSKDALTGIETFLNVPGAKLSAGYVADAFRCFGEGTTLLSNRNRLLSKDMMLQSIDSLVRIASKDSFSTTIIYYCGHGFTDNDGNLYFVPGNHLFNSTSESLESLLSLDQIQQRINSILKKEYPRDSLLKNDPEIKKAYSEYETALSKIENDEDTPDDFMTLNRKYFATVREKKMKLNRPKFLIIADCCTEDVAKVNYSVFINKENYRSDKSREMTIGDIDWKEVYKQNGIDSIEFTADDSAEFQKAVDNMNSILKDKVLPALKPLQYSASVMGTKSESWINGHRTFYSAGIGKLVSMVQSPFDRNDSVGPVSRRICLYFANKKSSFTVADLLAKLTDEKFDKRTEAPVVEDAFNSTMSFDPKKAFSGMDYKMKTGRNYYSMKRDSILFFCR